MSPARAKSWILRWSQRAATGGYHRIVNGLNAAGNLLFPPACTFCGSELAAHSAPPVALCPRCLSRLVDDEIPVCVCCASPLPQHWGEHGWCPRCRGRGYHFERSVALGIYRNTLRQAVIWMKQPAHEPLARAMARLLAQRAQRHYGAGQFDLIAPVPMHWWRRVIRGTHSAGTLGSVVARSLALPCRGDLLYCRRKTRKQGTLRPRERLRNVRDAFCVSSGYDITDARILVLDDVMTTGATLSEVARVLRRAGAGRVSVAVVARGVGEP